MGGLIVHYIPSLLVILVPPSKDIYSFILNVEGYPAQFISLALCIGLIWLRFERPDLKRPFKAWIPGVFLRILLSLTLLAAPFAELNTPSDQPNIYRVLYAIVGASM
jgi:Amino acid permease